MSPPRHCHRYGLLLHLVLAVLAHLNAAQAVGAASSAAAATAAAELEEAAAALALSSSKPVVVSKESAADGDGEVATTLPPAGMQASEKEAFYQVMQSMSFEWNWRSLLPDPCGANLLPGMNCDSDEDESSGGTVFHVTALVFGSAQSNTPPCSSNASVPPAMLALSHLKSLTFDRCFQSSSSLSPVPTSLPDSLLSLTFLNNPGLSGELPPDLGRLTKLQRLVFIGNSLTGRLPAEIGELRSLEQLVISRNTNANTESAARTRTVAGAGETETGGIRGGIPASFGNLTQLVILDLSENKLDGKGLPAELGALHRLRKLDLSRNALTGELPGLAGLTGLELLDLRSNAFNTSVGFPPPSLLQLRGLREVYLADNPSLTGPLTGGAAWSNLRRLISLDLSGCGLTGRVPAELSLARSLRFLSLARNKFSGPIPVQLARLSDVYEINLSGNLLSGRLPFTLDFVERLGRNLKLKGNPGLCSVYGRLGINACPGRSTVPLAVALDDGQSTALVPAPVAGPASSGSAELGLHLLPLLFFSLTFHLL